MKPTALKLLQGNAGKRALPKNEPKPPVGADRPAHLTREARAVWDEIAPQLTKLRVLTEVDAVALAHLCNLEANRRELVKLKDTLRGKDDLGVRLKVMSEERKLAPQIVAALGRFGMTPSDRAKVSTAGPGEVDPFEAFLGTR